MIFNKCVKRFNYQKWKYFKYSLQSSRFSSEQYNMMHEFTVKTHRIDSPTE